MVTLALPQGLSKGLKDSASGEVLKALHYADEHLSDLNRRSGESYAVHGEEVATTLRELTDDPSLLSIALLHDLPVHPYGDHLLERSPLSKEDKKLVRQMHRLRRLHIDADIKDLDTVISSFLEHAKLLPLRMAHRVNDVRHISRFSGKLRKEIAYETLHMYTAIAGRLGMHTWRKDMEDNCFRVTHPDIAKDIEQQFAETADVDYMCLEHTKKFVKKQLKDKGIPCEIFCRVKAVYSTYRKMIIKQRGFHDLTDRLALRILLENNEDCYRALGIVHSCMRPMPGKLKDYIGAPKENGYRSIHTVVYPMPGVTEFPMEIQFRTKQMEHECNYGMHNHGEYKSYQYSLNNQRTRVNLFRNLETLRQESRTPEQFAKALRMYFSDDQVAVFDKENNLYYLKKPSCALDFAGVVYQKRCQKLKEIHVNGRKRPLDTLLQDGDTVEVLFGRDRQFKDEWIEVCRLKATRKLMRELSKV